MHRSKLRTIFIVLKCLPVIAIILVIVIFIANAGAEVMLAQYNSLTASKDSGSKQLQFIQGFVSQTGSYDIVKKLGLAETDEEAEELYNSISGQTDTSTDFPELSASVQEIINMSEADVWKLISGGKYSSYDEANKAAQNNPSAEEDFWKSRLVTVSVPCWKWADSSKSSKVSSTCNITVNSALEDYFKSFMTDLYNCSEQYVIVDIGGFSFRTKNTASGPSVNYSGHSFGATLDINSTVDGMKLRDVPYANPSEPTASQVCSFNSSWYHLAERYKLDWGGNWSSKSLDPMHFSLVGDNNKDTRSFSPKVSGR